MKWTRARDPDELSKNMKSMPKAECIEPMNQTGTHWLVPIYFLDKTIISMEKYTYTNDVITYFLMILNSNFTLP